MNFLELVQDLFYEARLAGSAPTTVLGQVGELNDLVRWVRDAATEIGGIRAEFLFKIANLSFDTSANVGSYTLATLGLTSTFREWMPTTFRQYLISQGVASEQFMTWLPYSQFRDYYLFGSHNNDRGQPVHVSADENDTLVLGPVPDAAYRVTAKVSLDDAVLAADADIPGLPVNLHKLIVYRALQQYGLTEAATEVIAKAERGEARLKVQLRNYQLPLVELGAPLA